jgi:hypothetical protein
MIISGVETDHLETWFRDEEQKPQKAEQEEISIIVYTLLLKRKLFIATKLSSLTIYSFPLRRCYTNFFPMMELVKQFPKFRETPSYKHGTKEAVDSSRRLLHQRRMPDRNFRYTVFGIFCCIPVFLFIYSTILAVSLNVFCGKLMVPQNCACKTLLYVDIQNVSAMVPEEEPDGSKDVGRVWLADRNFKKLYCGGLKMRVNLSNPTGYFTY